jgi:hypothetical protein
MNASSILAWNLKAYRFASPLLAERTSANFSSFAFYFLSAFSIPASRVSDILA